MKNDGGETFYGIGLNGLLPSCPRVLARITEETEDTRAYRARCEACAFTDEYEGLAYIARVARDHAIMSGHAVLVEAL